MNFKNFSIILALFSFELKVFSIPVNDIASDAELNVVDISESVEWSAGEISNIEVVNNEFLTEDPNDDSDADSNTELETTGVTTEESLDLPCSDVQTCNDWFKKNKELLTSFGLSVFANDEVIDGLFLKYQDEKNIENLRKNFETVDYGMKVDVNGLKMTVDIKGEEHDKTIVILPGLGIASPIIFYGGLAETLAKQFKVVIVEPFGYGTSDLTTKDRTAENIVSEIHTCLQNLGIDQFYFMGHSIGGIYSIIYDNTYKNEVLGFIGLDNTPSNIDVYDEEALPKEYYTISKIIDKYHLIHLLPEDQKKILLEPELTNLNYSEKEVEDLTKIHSYRFYNINIIEEDELSVDNIFSTNGMYFHCPLLMFISEETQTRFLKWKEYHENMINDNPNKELIGEKSNVIFLEKTTNTYIFAQNKDVILNEINNFIN